MTLNEFKAWFEGFTEDMDGPPNEKQWKRIKARVKDITGSTVTERVFLDRYLPSRRGYDLVGPWGGRLTATGAAPQVSTDRLTTYAAGRSGKTFNSLAAMSALGRSDAAQTAAG